jgi:signal transduction histidine kinase
LRSRIFESFLTARKDGTGLGLAICKRILRDHRGDIELVEDSTSKGATFRFWLPRAGG